jgi:hypothetical protein
VSHDGQSIIPNAQNPLSPAQRYVVHVARATVEAHKVFGAEAVARWNAPPAGTDAVADTADLPGALVFAYDITVRQISQLLAIIDTLTADHPTPQADYGTVRERAYVERRVIQAALAADQTRQDVARTAAEAQDEWRSAASDAERARLIRAAEETIHSWPGAS